VDLSPVVLAIPIYFLLIAIELVVDYFAEKKVYRLNDALTNISCGIVSQLSGLGLKVLSVGVYHFLYSYARLWDIPTTWYTLIVLFVAVDFAYYWAHRMSHEINLFWGGHVVHHQSEDYNFTVALRQSSFQTIWTFFFYLPLAVIGFNTIDFVLMAGLTTVYQFWIHTPYIKKLPQPIEYIFNTPSHHRVHHGRNPKYIDRNHAGVFIVWDKMFGTFQEEEETPTYGITKPINSWNPVWANFEHYFWMSREIRSIPGLRNKILYLFKKPGWLPKELGGQRSIPEVTNATYKKFQTRSSNGLNWYNLFQFVFITGFTAVILFLESKFSMIEILGSAVLIVWGVASIGMLFENNRIAQVLEVVRVIITSTLIIVVVYQKDIGNTPLLIVVGYLIVSLLFFLLVTKSSNEPIS